MELSDIDLSKDGVYIVKNKEIHRVKPPESGYGEQAAVWINHRIDRMERKEIDKFAK